MSGDFPFNGDPTGSIPMGTIAYDNLTGAQISPFISVPSSWPFQGPVPQPRVELAETPPDVIRWALGLMTPNELAGALGVKEGTLSVWRSTGEGPKFIKLGKQVFYRLDDLNQWVWSKYPQVKNTHTEAGEGTHGKDAEQEVFPFVQHDENQEPTEKSPGPWSQAPTTGL